MRPEFFSLPSPRPEPSPAFYRDFISKATAKQKRSVEAQFLWARDSTAELEKHVIFPIVDLPDFHAPSDPSKITDDQIEAAATATRRHWGLGDGVIRDVIKLLETKGCVVVSGFVQCDAIDAFSRWTYKGRPLIVVNFRSVSAARRRIDAAHELGHLVLHKNVDKRFLSLSARTHRLIEGQAFRFASAFLMPVATFQPSVPSVSLDALLLAKPQWHLSVAAMLHRATELNMVNPEKAKRLWINLTRRGWRKNEPLDDILPMEQPMILARALRTLQETDYTRLEKASAATGLELDDFERFASLSSGTLRRVETYDLRLAVRDNLEISVGSS